MTIDTNHAYRLGEFLVDARRRVLERGGIAVELQPKVFDTLLFLVRRADRVVTKDELLDAVWAGTIVTEDALTRAVSALRKALGDDAGAPWFLRAVRGVGYRVVASVQPIAAAPTATTRPRSLAVLPFRPVVPGARNESLEVGMADTLIARLSVLPDLVVRPLDSVRSYLDGGTEAQTLGRALRVDAYLEASLQTSGERLRVNARLVSCDDGRARWSASFDEQFADVFEVQDRICDRIVASLTPRVTEAEAAPRPSVTTPEAYRRFLEGRLYLARRTSPDLERACAFFEEALDEAPTFAEAWAALGQAHEGLGTDRGEAAGEHFIAARRAARRALALAPGLPEAECLLAQLAWQHDWDTAAAERIFVRALARAPHRADLHIAHADYCCYVGRATEGIEHARRALAIDPVSPWCNALLAQALYMAGRYDEARTQAERTLELEPGFAFARLFAGLAAFAAGDLEGGIARLEEAVSAGRRDFSAALGLCYGKAGRKDDARRILEALEADAETVPPFALAVANLGCDRPAEAATWLERCIERKQWHASLFRWDPLFAEFSAAPRFRKILARMGEAGA